VYPSSDQSGSLCYPFDDACRLYPSLRRGIIFWITMPLFVRGFLLLYSASPLREAFPFLGRRYPSSDQSGSLCYPFDNACRLYPSLPRGFYFWITMPLFVRGFFLLYSASPLREGFPFFGWRYPSS
jgi:hypothetical protein